VGADVRDTLSLRWAPMGSERRVRDSNPRCP